MKRTIAGTKLKSIGLGCMNLTHHAYGKPPSVETSRELLRHAFDIGVQHFDTAALYGSGRNEQLLGEMFHTVRNQVFIASKGGLRSVGATRVIDGRPSVLKKSCEDSLKRLQTDYIDLFYLHRLDKAVPIEESVGALGDLVRAGKIRGIGLCEVSVATLRRAHTTHPIAAVQSEYSLWTRNPEFAVLELCREIGAAFVAFSPVARGFLAGGIKSGFGDRDIRAHMPRFQEPNLAHNLRRYEAFEKLARRSFLTPTQLALAWVLSRGDHVHVIPGTTNIRHVIENNRTPMNISADVLTEAQAIINEEIIHGARYPASVLAEMDEEPVPHGGEF
ncbi:MAG: aldo/keto reductase [Asticcacaulis sp.]|uniref:aldo/keto reductase n=1 Tax=Asticcacaulis sp. TaxID=1872648 RepID=UPI0039E38C2A